jgi:GT2 family glycosyltransferase
MSHPLFLGVCYLKMLHGFRSLVSILITVLLVPFLLALGLTLLFLNLVYVLTRFARRRVPPARPAAAGQVSIIVLNWNGRELLASGIPSILEAVRLDGRAHEILVVDNGSTDGSIDYIKKQFPEVRVLPLKKNLGFAKGNNAGVRAASNDIVILLNNDMIVDPGFIAPLLQGFGPKTFAVSSQIFHQDPSIKREETGKTAAVFRRGMIDYAHRDIPSLPLPREYYPVFWAGGGSSAFHRDKFLALGGFQDLFSPAYVEDADLSYQAWRVGWEVLLAPKSIVYHKHRASTNLRFSRSQVRVLVARNQFLFLWKNIQNWRLLLEHVALLPWNCYRLTRDHTLALWRSILRAACAIPSVEIARLRFRFRTARTDRQIFDIFAKPGLYFGTRAPGRNEGDAVADRRPRLLWLTAYLPHTGRHAGAGRMFQLLKRISTGYRITLLTFMETEEERIFLPEVEPLCEKVVAMTRSRNRRLQLFPYEPFDEFLTPEMEQEVDCCLEDQDFDLIQLEYTQMACYAGRSAGIPTLLTKHEVDFAACARRARLETNPAVKLRWFYNYLQVLDREIKLSQNVDAVICMTECDARKFTRFGPPVPVYVINTGVDLNYFKLPEQPAAGARMIFVGAFQHLPNVEAMQYFCRDILPLIRKEVPDIELLIVGSNPSSSIWSLGKIKGVHVTGFVPDIRPLMAQSSVYIVPLRLGVGIRGKILEAWSMGMAVVSTSIGCAGLLGEDNRNILIADTPEQFAGQVCSLIKDPMLRQRLGEEGRRTAEQHYGWERSTQQLDALYRRYLNSGTRPVNFLSSDAPVSAAGPKGSTPETEGPNKQNL